MRITGPEPCENCGTNVYQVSSDLGQFLVEQKLTRWDDPDRHPEHTPRRCRDARRGHPFQREGEHDE